MGKENRHDFARALRGYNVDEVESHIDSLEEKIRALEEEKINLAEVAATAKAALEESNTKRGLAEKVLADAGNEAERIIAEATARAEKIEADGKIKADAIVGAALLEEKKTNERLERNIVEKERVYNAFCDKHNEFKNTIFALYASHISLLEDIIANRVPESYEIPEEKKTKSARPEKKEVPREEIILPAAEEASGSDDDTIASALGIKVSRESAQGETVGSIMRELDVIKSRIAEKEKKIY